MTRLLQMALLAAALCLTSGNAFAGEKSLMHCFAFTEVEDAKDADWKAFFEATDALVGKIDGLEKVWYGKLKRPLGQYDKEGKRSLRQWGVCMEMKDSDALTAYSEHDAHAEWVKVYAKVRVPGTTTYDILGQ
jgi:hypothetical protein